jgi:LacI family transcriptional regulator
MAKVKLEDIAKVAGISVSAVSMALSDYPDISPQTRLRVLDICRELDYTPRRKRMGGMGKSAATKGKVTRIGVAMVGYDRATQLSLGWTPWVQHLAQEGKELGCKIEVAVVPPGDESMQMEGIAQAVQGVDGVILDGYVRSKLMDYASALPVPTLLMGNHQGDELLVSHRWRQVCIDMRQMGQIATRAVIRKGHKRIGFVSMELHENLWYDQWLAGYRHAMVDAGMPVDKALIKTMAYTPDTGMEAAKYFLNMADPATAYVVPNVWVANGFLIAAKHLGKPIDPNRLVVGCSKSGATDFGFEGRPLVMTDNLRMARMSLEVLMQWVSNSRLQGCKVIVPIDVSGLEKITGA